MNVCLSNYCPTDHFDSNHALGCVTWKYTDSDYETTHELRRLIEKYFGNENPSESSFSKRTTDRKSLDLCRIGHACPRSVAHETLNEKNQKITKTDQPYSCIVKLRSCRQRSTNPICTIHNRLRTSFRVINKLGVKSKNTRKMNIPRNRQLANNTSKCVVLLSIAGPSWLIVCS